jgi:predicted acylesterase/phospholipase RssA
VVAQNTNNAGGSPKCFRTYGEEAEKVKIWEACRATAAAPTVFEPIRINGIDYIDGGRFIPDSVNEDRRTKCLNDRRSI